MTDPFTTNLVVKGPVVKGSVVKGATSVIIIVIIIIIIIYIIILNLMLIIIIINIITYEEGEQWCHVVLIHPQEISLVENLHVDVLKKWNSMKMFSTKKIVIIILWGTVSIESIETRWSVRKLRRWKLFLERWPQRSPLSSFSLSFCPFSLSSFSLSSFYLHLFYVTIITWITLNLCDRKTLRKSAHMFHHWKNIGWKMNKN